ncbi:unnamed protein product [Penicillium pancosmium]
MDPKDTDIEMKLATPSPEMAHAHKQSAKITTLQKSVTTLQSQIDSIQSDLMEILPKLQFVSLANTSTHRQPTAIPSPIGTTYMHAYMSCQY